MGVAYEFTRCASANLRQSDDAWNSFWGGLAGGSMLGLRRMPSSTSIDLFTRLLSSIQSALLPPSPATEPPLLSFSVPGSMPVVRSPDTQSIPQSTRLHEKSMFARTEGGRWKRHLSRLARAAVWTFYLDYSRTYTNSCRHLRTRLPGEKS